MAQRPRSSLTLPFLHRDVPTGDSTWVRTGIPLRLRNTARFTDVENSQEAFTVPTFRSRASVNSGTARRLREFQFGRGLRTKGGTYALGC
jgi:hypothetical protein